MEPSPWMGPPENMSGFQKRPRRMKRGQIRDLNVQDQQGLRDHEE